LTKSTIDIFALLSFLDENEMSIYQDFSEDKEVLADLVKNIGWLIPQWMSSSQNDRYHKQLLLKVNNQANVVWSGLSKSPELQTKLLASCGLGHSVSHKFYKPSGNANLSQILELLILQYPDITESQVVLWCKINDIDTLQQVAEQCGYQTKEIQPLMDSYQRLKLK